MKHRNNYLKRLPDNPQPVILKYRFFLPKLLPVVLIMLAQVSIQGLTSQYNVYAQTPAESMEEAKHILNDFGGSLKEVNDRIEKTEGYYNQFRECVTGRGDTGRECQQYIDLLYASVGIEAHEAVMDVKMTMEEILHQFESTRAFDFLIQAKNGFSTAANLIDNAKNVIDFADQFQKYNPEGARGDPTRGLRMIGEAIGEAAGKLPFPMNKIFEGYAESVVVISGKLVDLQGKIEDARQGNLGGGYSSYADAQTYFEQNFEGQDGRSSIEFFDVSSQFSLLGSDVQVFQNFVSLSMEFYIYDQSLGRNRGWIAPPVFQTVYHYFAAMPAQYRGEISAGYRAELLVSQAKTNPGIYIEQAKQHYQKFIEAEGSYIHQRILEEMGLWDTMSTLITHGEDAFVGLWLFSSEKHNEIQRVLDVLMQYVYAEGTVMRETGTVREPAPNEPVELEVEDGGFGQAVSDANGAYFVFARGQLDSRFTIRAGQGEELFEDTGRFYQQGFNNWVLVLKKVEKIPISISLAPEEATLEIGDTRSFTATAIFEDESTLDVTENTATSWSSGSNLFNAVEAGEFVVTVSYMGLSAQAIVTVEVDEEEQICGDNEIWNDEEQACVCADGFELSEELGKCINIDEAIEEITEGELCDEENLAAQRARLDDLVSTGSRIGSEFQNTFNKFMKEVNDQNANPCENNLLAVAYAGAKQRLGEYQTLVDEATEISTDLILEGAICPVAGVDPDISTILQRVSQLGRPLNQIEQGIADMDLQLYSFGCDEQEVSDRGDTIAERGDLEVLQGGGAGAVEICGDGIDNDGDGLIDEGCGDVDNFNVIIVLFDSGTLPDDVFGLSVTGQGNLGTTPEGGSRTYPLRLAPGSYIATVTVISAPDNVGTYTIRILEGNREIASQTGQPPQGSMIDVPFTVGQSSDQIDASLLMQMMNFEGRIEQSEGNY